MEIAVFLGAPGSGKGTQAKRLAQTNQFIHFSTGDMLRAATQDGTEVGVRAKQFVDRGELVPDSVMIELIEGALSRLSSPARVILDGFPRTVPQAEALDAKKTTEVKLVIYFEIAEPALIKRLTGRRVCQKCGESYHVSFLPSKREGVCDRCGGPLLQRSDDSESVVRRRLEVFAAQNTGLLKYYQDKHKLKLLDADQPIERIQAKLAQFLH